jgi:hypothetical protein
VFITEGPPGSLASRDVYCFRADPTTYGDDAQPIPDPNLYTTLHWNRLALHPAMIGAADDQSGVSGAESYVIASIRVHSSLFIPGSDDHSNIPFMTYQLEFCA